MSNLMSLKVWPKEDRNGRDCEENEESGHK